MPKFESIEIDLKIPYIGGVKGKWIPNKNEKLASWELYVELITRISVVELKGGEGILREALNSLYSIFNTTREILRKYGPDVASKKAKSEYSFGKLSIVILNYVIRPVLTKWHPLLLEYEQLKPDDCSIKEHEDKWEKNEELRADLDKTRNILVTFSGYLAEVSGIDPFYKKSELNGVKKT